VRGKRIANSSDQITGISGRHSFGCGVFVFREEKRGLNAKFAEGMRPSLKALRASRVR